MDRFRGGAGHGAAKHRLPGGPPDGGGTADRAVHPLPPGGVLTGGWESRPGDVAKLEEETARAMYQAVAVLQRAEADATDLLGRAGLSNPLRWQALSSQWPTAFSTLPVEVSVTITVTERQ